MKLLIFAHSGEAREFIKNLPALKARFDLCNGLYLSEEWGLLITGEGMDQVFLKLGRTFAQISDIKWAYNFGIAASLTSELPKNRIISVRTVYRYLGGPMEFKSYTTHDFQDGRAGLDCVSCFERIQDPKVAQKISPFGQMADRELWAIAALGHFHQIPFASFKLISDYAWESGSCEQIKTQSREYSCLLYQKFCDEILNKSLPQQMTPYWDAQALFPDLHWTESQRRQFVALNKQWRVQYSERSIQDLFTNDIKTLDIHQKKRTAIFLQKIKDELGPINAQLRKEIEQIIAQYSPAPIKVHYDPRLESTDLKVTMAISNEADLELCRYFSCHFPLKEIQAKIEGKDVP